MFCKILNISFFNYFLICSVKFEMLVVMRHRQYIFNQWRRNAHSFKNEKSIVIYLFSVNEIVFSHKWYSCSILFSVIKYINSFLSIKIFDISFDYANFESVIYFYQKSIKMNFSMQCILFVTIVVIFISSSITRRQSWKCIRNHVKLFWLVANN